MVGENLYPKAEVIQVLKVRAFSMVSAVVKVFDTTTTANTIFCLTPVNRYASKGPLWNLHAQNMYLSYILPFLATCVKIDPI
jgi:hypothetical protein